MNKYLILSIFLGLFCTGLSVELPISIEIPIPIFSILYCIVAYAVYKMNIKHVNKNIEAGLLCVGIIVSYWLGAYLGANQLIFMSNGLVVYQLFRLACERTKRQSRLAMLVCLAQVWVGLLIIANFLPFILIFSISIFLLPKALTETENLYFPVRNLFSVFKFPKVHLLPISLVAVLVFVALPRIKLSRSLNPLQNAVAGQGELQKKADTSNSVDGGGERMVFQIEGKQIGYLRTVTLDKFDGLSAWEESTWIQLPDTKRSIWGPIPKDSLERSVKIISTSLLRNSLPVDGRVEKMDINTGNRFYLADGGGALTPLNFHDNPSYRFWTYNEPIPSPMNKKFRKRYLNIGGFEVSNQLKQFLDTQMPKNLTDQETADFLTNYFIDNFTYELGAPKLDRISAIDDFMFNEKTGHCERYASTLALLLRLKGIPSRVVLGYVPREYNNIAGFYNVRTKNAHAWTEAYIQGKGWVQFDATPYEELMPYEEKSLGFTLIESFRYFWFNRIVEFDSEDRSDLIQFSKGIVTPVVNAFINTLPQIVLVCVIVYLVYMIKKNFKKVKLKKKTPKEQKAESMLKARSFYGKLLRSLAKQGYEKPIAWTPNEFAQFLSQQGYPLITEIKSITKTYCDIYYGSKILSEENESVLQAQLAIIAAKK
ncbi:MAG: DUF3488 and transglutaminase-like domain-containing protein [Lentisphaeria bacterium]|nr:DUF3488 and transglutaminase-like domain-containing protein [Lentisphaeria bacterium]